MKLSDLIIIYLACGAPFGMYFFLHHRNQKNSGIVYLKSVGIIFVWIPYAVRLLNDFITNRFRLFNDQNLSNGKLEKDFSQLLFNSGAPISLFEFREIFERYIGLTRAQNSTNNFPSKTDEEIFRVALRQNIKLGATCLRRRNRRRIKFHQESARRDFLQIVSELNHSTSDKAQLQKLAFEFVDILKDAEAAKSLREIFEQPLQKATKKSVHQMEDLWTAERKQQSSVSNTPLRLRALSATRKD